ncbi:MAG: tolB1 [Solirubrobacterales bacterium]|nr:tolB1 [Solirubrobacterales bacterium]
MISRLVAVGAFALALAVPAAAGATIVYDKGVASAHPSVWIAADDGSGGHRLTAGQFPHIAPDGQTVLFELPAAKPTGFKPRLMKIPAAGGTPTVLVAPVWSGDGFAWSPNSKTIATVTGPEVGTKRLVLVDVATGAQRTVARGTFVGVSFSPDGASIAYARAPRDGYPFRSEIYTAAVAGGAPVKITTGGHSQQPVWGPTAIAITRQRRSNHKGDGPKQDVFLVQPNGTGLKRLTRTKVPYLLTGPAPREWSADGTHLLAEFGGQDTDFAETVDPVTGKFRLVGTARNGIIGWRLSHDGSTILGITGGYDPTGPHDLVSVPYAGGTPTILARHAFAADWTR